MNQLDENMLGEMWLLMRLRSGMRAMRTGQHIHGPCNDHAFSVGIDERRKSRFFSFVNYFLYILPIAETEHLRKN